MNLRKMISFTLTGILLTNLGFAQVVATPTAAPAAPAARPAVALPKPPGQCTFEPQLTAEDSALLESAKTTINALRQNSKCSTIASQFDAFQEALKAYNQQTGMDRVPGYDGNLSVTCANYDLVWNSNFESFVSNWDLPATDLTDPYYTCRSSDNKEEAIECAALQTGRSKALKKSQCEAQKDAITAQATSKLLNDTYVTGLEAMQAILNNNDCIDSAGEQKLSFIQSAVSLASRAASLSVLGTGAGLLVGAASSVVGNAIKNFFSSRARNRDHLAILDNRENFTKVACLYEQVEAKALRCDRIQASSLVNHLERFNSRGQEACMEDEAYLISSNTIQDISNLIKNLQSTPVTPPAAPAAPGTAGPAPASANATPVTPQPLNNPQDLDMATFDKMITGLTKTPENSDVSILDSGIDAAQTLDNYLSNSTASDDALKSYIQETTGNSSPTSAELRTTKRELEEKRTRGNEVLGILTAIKDADAKGTSMTDADLTAVKDKFKNFNGGNYNFSWVFNELLTFRATIGDDVGQKLQAYNSKISDVSAYLTSMNYFKDKKDQSQRSFDDGGRFMDSRAAIRPHLKKLLDKELTALGVRAKELIDVPVGAPSQVLRNNLMTQEEGVIYPILRACNQLKSISADEKRNGTFDVSSSNEPEICKAFTCNEGVKSFENYLSDAGLSDIDPKNCSTNCKSHFDKYICENRETLEGLRYKVKDEFVNKGTICGKSLSAAFGKLKKKSRNPLAFLWPF